MPKYKRIITDVFNGITPISVEQVEHRAFIPRADYKEQLLEKIFQDSVLIISGYSGIGKTSLLNLVTNRRGLHKINAPFRAVVSVGADKLNDSGLLKRIYDEIFFHISGKALEILTPGNLAHIIHTNQLLLIIDGINSLYNDISSSKELFNLCKSWTDLPKGIKVQSKIILVASGIPHYISQWLSRSGDGRRLPYDHINIPPWNINDLLKILHKGAQYLGLTFDLDLQKWMSMLACGLPASMNLLAALTACRSNNDRTELLSINSLRVGLLDLKSVFGEGDKFKNALWYDEKIERLSTSGILAIYLIGLNQGSMNEKLINEYLGGYGFLENDLSKELDGLITVENKNEEIFWNLNELSYGTFAFLRLYYRSKLAYHDDALQIEEILNLLHESEIVTKDEEKQQPEKGGEIMSINNDVSRLIEIIETIKSGMYDLEKRKVRFINAKNALPPNTSVDEITNHESRIAQLEDEIEKQKITLYSKREELLSLVLGESGKIEFVLSKIEENLPKLPTEQLNDFLSELVQFQGAIEQKGLSAPIDLTEAKSLIGQKDISDDEKRAKIKLSLSILGPKVEFEKDFADPNVREMWKSLWKKVKEIALIRVC